MPRRPNDIEFGDGPITRRRIDEAVIASDGVEAVPQRTSAHPPARQARVDPFDLPPDDAQTDGTYEATGFGD